MDFTFLDLNTGIFTVPISGFYHICYSFRVKGRGVADFTIREMNIANGVDKVIGAFGSRCTKTCDW